MGLCLRLCLWRVALPSTPLVVVARHVCHRCSCATRLCLPQVWKGAENARSQMSRDPTRNYLQDDLRRKIADMNTSVADADRNLRGMGGGRRDSGGDGGSYGSDDGGSGASVGCWGRVTAANGEC